MMVIFKSKLVYSEVMNELGTLTLLYQTEGK